MTTLGLLAPDNTEGLLRVYGVPESGDRVQMDEASVARFIRKLARANISLDNGPCLLWTGAVNGRGYGRFRLPREDNPNFIGYAHLIAYQHFVGPVPEGWIVTHMCRQRFCCRPGHLQAKPEKEVAA